jgi:flavodoxin
MSDKKILIAFYSHSGNTKNVAEKIQEITDGDLYEIKTNHEYPKNYTDIVNQAKKEKEQEFKPELTEHIDISNYDTIFIGSPVWWYTFASPIRTFLSDNDFSGKVIKPFCTHGGGGAYTTYTDIKDLCPDAQVKEGFTVYENSASDSDIQKWVNE